MSINNMRGEFQFLFDLKKKYGLSHVGDDCAVVSKDSNFDLLLTADVLHEDIDFRNKWAPANSIGHKALAVSLSDIAAMGGIPKYSLISLSLPREIWNTDFADKFYEGYIPLAKIFGVELIGGDISESNSGIVIDSVLIGEVEKGTAIMRTGARPGDLIYVSGTLGDAAAGLEILEAGENPHENHLPLIDSLLNPVPRIPEARELRNASIVTSMIDLSDGLSGDLAHICASNDLGAAIYTLDLPISQSLANFCVSEEQRIKFALHGGEDFELLFTVDPAQRNHPLLEQFTYIGELNETSGLIEISDGASKCKLENQSFTHFTKRSNANETLN